MTFGHRRDQVTGDGHGTRAVRPSPPTPPRRPPSRQPTPAASLSGSTTASSTHVLDRRPCLDIALWPYPFGADALAVYAVLARRAGRDGESWERVKPMARLAATKERTFQRCIRLLELLGLVASSRATSRAPTSRPATATPCSRRRTSRRTSIPTRRRWPPPAAAWLTRQQGSEPRHVTDARPKASEREVDDAPGLGGARPAPIATDSCSRLTPPPVSC